MNENDSHARSELPQNEEAPFFTREFARALAALSCLLVTQPLMNTAVFPAFDGVFGYARDISVTLSALTLVAIGLAATFRPALLKVKPANRVLVGFMVAGAVALPAALIAGSPALLVAAASIAAIGRAWASLVAALAVSRLSLKQAGVCVPLAFVAQCAFEAFAWVAPRGVSLALFLVLPIASWALSWSASREVLFATEQGEAPNDFSVTRPSSFLPLASQLFACLFLFRMAFGFSLRFGEGDAAPVLPAFLIIVPVAATAIFAVLSRKRFPSDTVVQLSVLLVIAGFLAAMLDIPGAHSASVVLLSSGNALFDLVAWIVLIAVAGRNSKGAVAVFAWGRGTSTFGTLLGAALGVWAARLAPVVPEYVEIVSGAMILLFAGYAMIALRSFSFRETIDGVTPVEDAVAEAPKPTFDARCAAIAERYGLTPREAEVFQMLARGRDRTYIQEQLVVSRNTVKSHVKHIYAKLDIHSHQDLIDLVEDV